MDGRWAPSIVEGWIDQIAAMDKWVAAFFGDPLGVNPGSVEVLGASYARLHPTWRRSSSYSLTLDAGFAFRGLAPGTSIVALGLMDGPFSNTLICRERLAQVATYPTGGIYSMAAGEWVIGLQAPVSV